jgi:hypothetical protein
MVEYLNSTSEESDSNDESLNNDYSCNSKVNEYEDPGNDTYEIQCKEGM